MTDKTEPRVNRKGVGQEESNDDGKIESLRKELDKKKRDGDG